MTTGFDAPVPDMVVLSPGNHGKIENLSQSVTVPTGYTAEFVKGQQPDKAEYEPFSPVAIYEVASYSKNIDAPGTYYVAIISPANDTHYSIAIGYLEGSVFRNGYSYLSISLVHIFGRVSPSS
jgi:hypothetical protein